MKRLILTLIAGCCLTGVLAPQAKAIPVFYKEFEETYAANEGDYQTLVKETKCNVCHVQGEKKEVRNAYGEALHEYLEKDNFKKERIEAEPEAVKAEIQEAFKKAGEKAAAEGKTFMQRIEAGLLPVE